MNLLYFLNSLPTFSSVLYFKVSRINAYACHNLPHKLCLLMCRCQHHLLLSENSRSRADASSNRLWIKEFQGANVRNVVLKDCLDCTEILSWPCYPWGIWLCQEQVPVRKGHSDMKPLICPEHKGSLSASTGLCCLLDKAHYHVPYCTLSLI